MEIGRRIKENRARLALSQDALAEKVYVSRQTISSWENGKTYPDVQSLLLLSAVFDVTVDALIKEDVATMEKKIQDARKDMARMALATVCTTLLFAAAIVWLAWQQEAGWGDKVAPTLVLVALTGVVAVATGIRLALFWGGLDLKTYREVLDYARGREVRRDTASSRLARGSFGEQVIHYLPYIAVIGIVGYVLGFSAKALLRALSLA